MSTNFDTVTGAKALEIRRERGLNQAQFWAPLGVTQSGGSRYESGRNIPTPTKVLILIMHGMATEDDQRSGALLEAIRK